MLNKVEVLCHSSIRIENKIVIYVDPFRVKESYNDADYIFITHEHYDHFSSEDINKVRNDKSIIVLPEGMNAKALEIGFSEENIIKVLPNSEYTLPDISFETVPSYNIDKQYHPKENNWVGYIIDISGIRYFIAGDTDVTEDSLKVVCDIAFLPVGGTYTMTYKEAAKLANSIKPKIAIPTHYGEIVGSKEDAIDFINLLDCNIQGEILM